MTIDVNPLQCKTRKQSEEGCAFINKNVNSVNGYVMTVSSKPIGFFARRERRKQHRQSSELSRGYNRPHFYHQLVRVG